VYTRSGGGGWEGGGRVPAMDVTSGGRVPGVSSGDWWRSYCSRGGGEAVRGEAGFTGRAEICGG